MNKGKLTKSQINLLISAFLYGLGKKPFGVLRSTRVATLGPMLSQGCQLPSRCSQSSIRRSWTPWMSPSTRTVSARPEPSRPSASA
jgi:hypothetical protein